MKMLRQFFFALGIFSALQNVRADETSLAEEQAEHDVSGLSGIQAENCAVHRRPDTEDPALQNKCSRIAIHYSYRIARRHGNGRGDALLGKEGAIIEASGIASVSRR